MRYLFGFLCVCVLAALPSGASAQAGEEHSLSFWHDEALKIALSSISPAPSPETAPEEPALQLKLDAAGVEVTPTPEGFYIVEPTEGEERLRRRRRRAIGLGVGLTVVVVLVGFSIGAAVAVSNSFD